MSFFFENSYFSDKQYGFIKGRSTVLQLLKIMDDWTTQLDYGGQIDVIYTDFVKAFDTVLHHRQLFKFKTYNINTALVQWVTDFLCNRNQCVILNGEQSSCFKVLSGIPQGSILGPLLFLIYINDLLELKPYLGRDQYGFRRGCGTRDAIVAMRVLCDRSLEHNNKVFVCYADCEKAFDRVKWEKLMTVLKSIGVDWRDRRLIWNLYQGQSASVQVGNNLSAACQIGRGVRQGCSLSPLLFIIYDEAMVKEATAKEDLGVKVGGQVISMIRYADNKAVVASSEKNLQRLMDNVSRVTQKYGMKINVKKTKAMCISRQGKTKVKINIDGQLLVQVQQFR